MARTQSVGVIGIIVVSVLALPAMARALDTGVRISGTVTDFERQPVEGATVQLMDARFEAVASTTTGEDGTYALTAPQGTYMGLIAVKDYGTRSLEYWAWNVPAHTDLRIDPRFDRLEVYALNAWRPQGAYPSYQIYFRPMSLSRATEAAAAVGGREHLGKLPLLDIAPVVSRGDVTVSVDGEPVDVLQVNRVLEAAGPAQDMVAYVIQVELPRRPATGAYRMITVTLTDRETGERGEASLFVEADRLHPRAEPSPVDGGRSD